MGKSYSGNPAGGCKGSRDYKHFPKIEHYEIASYGTLAAFALTLKEEEAAALLQETLEEENMLRLH